MTYRYLETIFAATMVLLGATLFLHTFAEEYAAMSDNVGALLYPRFLFVMWIATALGILWNALRNAPNIIKEVEWVRIVIATACVAVFLFLFSLVGFVIASSIFFTLMALFLGAKNVLAVVALAVAYSYGINYVFTQLLQISLPALGD